MTLNRSTKSSNRVFVRVRTGVESAETALVDLGGDEELEDRLNRLWDEHVQPLFTLDGVTGRLSAKHYDPKLLDARLDRLKRQRLAQLQATEDERGWCRPIARTPAQLRDQLSFSVAQIVQGLSALTATRELTSRLTAARKAAREFQRDIQTFLARR